jgi:predicted outer membrane protein
MGFAGDDFDRSYIEWQILSHKDAIALFKVESESGDDKDARQFAIDTLPTLQAHLTNLLAMPMIAPATAPP